MILLSFKKWWKNTSKLFGLQQAKTNNNNLVFLENQWCHSFMIFLPAQRFKISLKTIQYNFQYPLSHLHTSPKVYLMFEKMTYLFFASVWHTSYPSSTLKKKLPISVPFQGTVILWKSYNRKKFIFISKTLSLLYPLFGLLLHSML